MIREINRKTWSSFCRKFNSTNRYRPARVAYKPSRQTATTTESDLLGISLTRRGRLIDGLDILAVRHDPTSLDQPPLNLPNLEKLTVNQDAEGQDLELTAIAKDGAQAKIRFTGDIPESAHDQLVEKIAYSLSEQRGFPPGGDQEDWLEAEERISRLISELP